MAKNKSTQVVTEPKEVEAAYMAIEGYFDAWGSRRSIKLMNKILEAAMSTKPSKLNPASVLYLFKTFRTLLSAVLVIQKTGYRRDAAMLVPPEDGYPDLSRRVDYCSWHNLPLWEVLPRMLSVKEYFNPYIVFKKAARYADEEEWNYILDDVLDYCFCNTAFGEHAGEYNMVILQRLLQKVIEASYLVFVRTKPDDGIEKPAAE